MYQRPSIELGRKVIYSHLYYWLLATLGFVFLSVLFFGFLFLVTWLGRFSRVTEAAIKKNRYNASNPLKKNPITSNQPWGNIPIEATHTQKKENDTSFYFLKNRNRFGSLATRGTTWAETPPPALPSNATSLSLSFQNINDQQTVAPQVDWLHRSLRLKTAKSMCNNNNNNNNSNDDITSDRYRSFFFRFFSFFFFFYVFICLHRDVK